MPGFVHAHLTGAGELELRDPPPTLVLDRRYELDALALELLDGLFDVMAHEEQGVMARAAAPARPGVDCSSPGGRLKISQPSPASTASNPSASRRNARARSASSAKMMVCAPAIMAGMVVGYRPRTVARDLTRSGAPLHPSST